MFHYELDVWYSFLLRTAHSWTVSVPCMDSMDIRSTMRLVKDFYIHGPDTVFDVAFRRRIRYRVSLWNVIRRRISLIHKKLVCTYFFIICLKINILECGFFLLKDMIITFKTLKTVSLKNDWQRNENSMNRGHFAVRTL